MRKIPCKECLKYPVCISKVKIRCKDLKDLFDDSYNELKDKYKYSCRTTDAGIKAWIESWKFITTFLPRCSGLISRKRIQR